MGLTYDTLWQTKVSSVQESRESLYRCTRLRPSLFVPRPHPAPGTEFSLDCCALTLRLTAVRAVRTAHSHSPVSGLPLRRLPL
eukprot:2947478-Prymnesium_polylepis.1